MSMVVWLAAGYGLVVGACLASFLGVVVDRVPQGRSIRGRSHCVCGRQLRNHENVPVLGWLRIRGRARCCGAQLPVTMLLGETALGLWGGGVFATGTMLGLAGSGWLPAALAALVALVAGCLLLLVLTWPGEREQADLRR